MRMKIELSEQEAKEALAAWAGQKYGRAVAAKDVSFSIAQGDPDPRSPSDTHVSQVTISLGDEASAGKR